MKVRITNGFGPFRGYEGCEFTVAAKQYEGNDVSAYFVDFFGSSLAVLPSECVEVVQNESGGAGADQPVS